jgi:crossover junction endodeoxyribonuclease RusA
MPEPPVCRFTLPPPPSTNALYANVPGKGRVKTRAYKAWITEAGWEIKIQLGGTIHTWNEPVGMLIEGVKRLDLDNLKAIPDLCKTMGLIADDRLITDLHIVRAGDKLTVSLWPMAEMWRGTVADRSPLAEAAPRA